MIDAKALSSIQLDALIEVVNIGSGHAATSLAQLLKKKIMFRVPRITTCTMKDALLRIAKPDDVIASVLVHFLGDLTGRALLVYPMKETRTLVSLLTPEMLRNSAILQESLLKEVSSILSSAYMNAFGRSLGLWVITTMPEKIMFNTKLDDILNEFGTEKNLLVCAETKFEFGNTANLLHAYFLLLPDSVSLETIVQRLDLVGKVHLKRG